MNIFSGISSTSKSLSQFYVCICFLSIPKYPFPYWILFAINPVYSYSRWDFSDSISSLETQTSKNEWVKTMNLKIGIEKTHNVIHLNDHLILICVDQIYLNNNVISSAEGAPYKCEAWRKIKSLWSFDNVDRLSCMRNEWKLWISQLRLGKPNKHILWNTIRNISYMIMIFVLTIFIILLTICVYCNSFLLIWCIHE